MRRFLVVGCGGSGGLTLQFVMDQLRADLSSHGIDELPRGWQFVHLDVPLSSDGAGPGRPPTVADQGGHYVSIGSARGLFVDAADALFRRLSAGPGLGGLVTWMPYPASVGVPIDEGAGQFRAVGRVLTLSKLERIRERLQNAWHDLDTGLARSQTKAAARVLSPTTVDDVDAEPYALVVSSMAGGTGASMAIDVCRILASVGPKPQMIAAVLHTAEVFYGLADNQRVGVEANAAAMIGEMMALQAGAGVEDDQALLRDLGLVIPTEARVPFRRVIPVGARIGITGEKMGDSPDDRCRGLGRALAALMGDGTAWEGFKKNTLENFGGPRNVNQSVIGWGVDPDNLVWGSLGYASVSLGRDRYAEYAAQRGARAAVDRLLDGHLGGEAGESGNVRLKSLTDNTLWPRAEAATGIPPGRQQIGAWLAAVAENRLDGVSNALAQQVRAALPDGQRPAASLVPLVFQGAARLEPQWREQVDRESYVWAWRWCRRITVALTTLVRETIAEFGLAAAREMLLRWEDHTGSLAAILSTRATSLQPASLAQPYGEDDQALTARLSAERGQIRADHQVITQVIDVLGRTVRRSLEATLGRLLGQLLPDVRDRFTQPLIAAISDRQLELEQARADTAQHLGQAQVRTSAYASWPRDESVPDRFVGAPNEVLLTSVEDFGPRFQEHARAEAGRPAFGDALSEISRLVLLGSWKSTGGRQSDIHCISESQQWRSQVLPYDVADDGTVLPYRQAPSFARFEITLTTEEVLRRYREFLARPNEPFAQFVGLSLTEYLSEGNVSESVLRQRRRDLVDKIGIALDKAQPMVAVDARKSQWMHGEELKVYYTFSALPAPDASIEADLLRLLQSRVFVMQPQTDMSLKKALVAGIGSRATRIDVYGSYPNLSPIVFTSLLEPVGRRWAQCIDDADRATFWRWKRARRLPGALPVGDSARRAMVTGWFAGRLFGLLRYPEESGGAGFRVYDDERSEWVQLPAPMPAAGGRPGNSAPPRRGVDRMVAVLEALSVRLAECATASPIDPLEPLRGFRILRELGDDGQHEPSGESALTRRAAQLWIDHGRTLSGVLPDQSGPADGPPEERRAAMQRHLADLASHFQTEFLSQDGGGGQPTGQYGRINTLDHAMQTPRFHELAQDALLAVQHLATLVSDGGGDGNGPDV